MSEPQDSSGQMSAAQQAKNAAAIKALSERWAAGLSVFFGAIFAAWFKPYLQGKFELFQSPSTLYLIGNSELSYYAILGIVLMAVYKLLFLLASKIFSS